MLVESRAAMVHELPTCFVVFVLVEGVLRMAAGKIKKMVQDKGFGFIQTDKWTRRVFPSFDRGRSRLR